MRISVRRPVNTLAMPKPGDLVARSRRRRLATLLIALCTLLLTFASLQWSGSRDPQAVARRLSVEELQKAMRSGEAHEIVFLELADRYRSSGRISEAINVLEQALGSGRENPRLHRELGMCYAQLKHTAAAAKHLQRATELAPSDYESYLYLGALLQANRQYRTAIDALQKAAHLNPESAEVWLRLGQSHEAEGNLREALTAYERLVALRNSDANARHLLGRSYHRQQRLEAARRELSRAVALEPARVDYVVEYGLMLLDLPADEPAREAARCFEHALELDARNGPAHFGRGVIFQRQGRMPEAAREFETALQSEFEEPAVCFHLAQIYRRLGYREKAGEQMTKYRELTARAERKQALGYLRREARLHPDRADVLYELGVFYEEKEHETGHAMDSYRRALSLQPNHAEARERLHRLMPRAKTGTQP